MTAHWGVEDPAAVEGSDEDKRKAFVRALTTLQRRIELFLSLPHGKLDKLALQAAARRNRPFGLIRRPLCASEWPEMRGTPGANRLHRCEPRRAAPF